MYSKQSLIYHSSYTKKNKMETYPIVKIQFRSCALVISYISQKWYEETNPLATVYFKYIFQRYWNFNARNSSRDVVTQSTVRIFIAKLREYKIPARHAHDKYEILNILFHELRRLRYAFRSEFLWTWYQCICWFPWTVFQVNAYAGINFTECSLSIVLRIDSKNKTSTWVITSYTNEYVAKL